jgi:large subunit ribosomal protein L19
MNPIIAQIEKEFLKKKVPEFRPGDTIKVSLTVKEGDKERIQNFEGVVIARKSGSSRETFTVRRISFGIGVERTFFVHSPVIQKLEVLRRGRVRRAKLFYLRDLGERKARIKEIVDTEAIQNKKNAKKAAHKIAEPKSE